MERDWLVVPEYRVTLRNRDSAKYFRRSGKAWIEMNRAMPRPFRRSQSENRIATRDAFGEDGELLAFARFYLSEAFPNPERTGCPPDDTLRLLAFRPWKARNP